MKAPLEILRGQLERVRRDFFSGERAKLWFAQQKMVQRAILYPARWLKQRAVPMTGDRYDAIVTGIFDTALRHGDVKRLQWVSRYLLHCVQEHMKHHGDEYYAEGKAIRNRVDVAMLAVEKAHGRAPDTTVDVLAEAEKLLAVGKRKPAKKDQEPPAEPDLFAKSN